MKKQPKDLTPKSPAKVTGGSMTYNDNITLVRAARPQVKGKDLTPKSPAKVTGGALTFNDNITLVRAPR